MIFTKETQTFDSTYSLLLKPIFVIQNQLSNVPDFESRQYIRFIAETQLFCKLIGRLSW
jgi:hypothetical protein